MPSEIQVDSNSIQNILIILIIVAVGCYLFYELRKIKQTIEELTKDVHMVKSKSNLLNQVPQVPQQVPQPEFNPIHSLDPPEIVNSLPTENETKSFSNFFNNEEIQVSKLPSDISSTLSIDDIEKLMLTDSDNDENLSELSFSDKVEDDKVEDDKVEDDKVEDKDYTLMTVNELKEILVSRNMPVSGNKTKLIQRIQEINKVI